MALDVESKQTLDEVVDRAQAAATTFSAAFLAGLDKSVAGALEQLEGRVHQSISDASAAAVGLLAHAQDNLDPILAEAKAWREELAAWRALLQAGIKIGG